MSAQFADMAKEAFSFLEDAGFHLARIEAGHLRYESPSSVVVIDWDARSGELEAFVGLRSSAGQSQDMYSLTDVFGMEGVPDRKMPPQVADENRLQPFVGRLADDLRVHAQPALVGDRMFFRRLETFRHANAEALTRGLQLQQVRSAVEQAWRNREFKKVVGLYASVEGDLSEAEKGKLDYARRHQAD
jgi:hypothetical protein